MDTLALITGNLCTVIGMIINAFSATRKTTKSVLRTQNLSQLFYCSGSVVLKGYSGAVQCIISILRNFTALRNINSKAVEWLLIALGVVLGVVCNNRGFIGLLPVIGNLQYTLAVFRIRENEWALKLSFLFSVLAFAVFNAAIFNFAGAASDLVVVITTAAVLVKSAKSRSDLS